jgi:palmitoyltransferase ZDHHC13/17
MTVTAAVIDTLTIMLHLSLVFMNPGILKNDDIEFLKLLETFESSSLCPECETIRTSRSRHCIICHNCVDRYDHHCPWINNCVGIRNHNLFLLYLLCQMTTLCITLL